MAYVHASTAESNITMLGCSEYVVLRTALIWEVFECIYVFLRLKEVTDHMKLVQNATSHACYLMCICNMQAVCHIAICRHMI